jgi:hypothetical protein
MIGQINKALGRRLEIATELAYNDIMKHLATFEPKLVVRREGAAA